MRPCSPALRRRAEACKTAIFVFLLCGIVPCVSAQRLPSNVAPTHYSLELAPDLKTATFSGVETIDGTIRQATNAITLNALEIAFQSVTIDAGGKRQTAAVSLDPDKQQATLSVPSTLAAGHAKINIRFTGILNSKLRGFYLSKTSRRNYAVSQLESTDARRAFPCFDEPALKATFDVKLVIDSGDMGISNSPVVSDKPGPIAGKHTIAFATTPKMSTYLLAFVVGDFKCTSGEQDGVTLRVCTTPDKIALTPFALDVAKFSVHYYDTYFGIHYPLKKLDLIAIPDFEAGAMENFGAITFRETTLLVDPKTASLRDQAVVAIDITHEIAHQWFGDLVTMQWWDNVWLNEGFATWMENKTVAAMHPEWNFPLKVAGDQVDTLNIDAQPTTRAIRAKADTPAEIEQLFDSIAYDKASEVLLMIEHYVGEETFRKGVHAYLTAHAYGNATAEDFWNAQTSVSHKPVDKIMESYVAQPGVPILTFGEPSEGKVSVEQRRFYLRPSISPDPAQKWTIPVCFKTEKGNQCDLLSPEKSTLTLPMSPIFFANAGGKGFYRTAYPSDKYAALVAHAETSLTPEERISLAGDEWAQVRANKVTVGDYLNLVTALRADPEAKVIAQAVKPLSAVAAQVASTDEERESFAAWIRKTFAPKYKKLGPPAPDDSPNTRELRAGLFALLASYGNDHDVLADARQIADRYLEDPRSVDPTLAETALAEAAKSGDTALFDKLQQIYETSTDPVRQSGALHALIRFENPALLNRALEYATSNKVRNQDTALLLAIALQTPANRDQTWQFIKTHWDRVHAQLTIESGSYLVRYSGGFCTAEGRDDVKSFFTDHEVAAADVALKHTLEIIDGCIQLRQLQEPNLKSWLAAQGAN